MESKPQSKMDSTTLCRIDIMRDHAFRRRQKLKGSSECNIP
jgi:hypothetical protein